jgi:hypothetical protein
MPASFEQRSLRGQADRSRRHYGAGITSGQPDHNQAIATIINWQG